MIKKKKQQITIRLPVELKEQLQQEADRRGYTLTDIILFILWDFAYSTTVLK